MQLQTPERRLIIPAAPGRGGRIYSPEDVLRCNPSEMRRGLGLGRIRPHPPVTYWDIFGPQLLGRYKLWGPDLVTDASYIESPLDLSNGAIWPPVRCTCTTGHADPAGGANAGRIVEDGTAAASHLVYQNLVYTSTGPVKRIRFRAKPDTRGYGGWLGAGTAAYAFWNFTNGAVTASLGCTPAAGVSLGGGWWQFDAEPTVDFTSGGQLYFLTSIDGTYAGRLYNGVLGQGAIYLYNPEIDQTSILTAPNGPALAARNLALYGDPYHCTNPTKSSQLVVGADVWDGLPSAIASGENWIACDEMAARFTGSDQPWWMIIPLERDAGSAADERIFSLGNSADNLPFHDVRWSNVNVYRTWRRDTAGTGSADQPGMATPTGRNVSALRFAGQTVSTWYNNGADIVAAAQNVGAMAVDQVTLAAFRRIAVASQAKMVARDLIMGMAASDAQMLAGINLAIAGNPIT